MNDLHDALASAGYEIDEDIEVILDLLASSIAFSEQELIELVGDMYEQPDKRPALRTLLENSDKKRRKLEKAHPNEYAVRRVRAQRAWVATVAHFTSGAGVPDGADH